MLRRSPGYALTCIAVLALGIGANAAIFSVIYSVILKPLPYPDPSRLVMVWERFPNMPDPPGSRLQSTHYTYQGWQRQNTVFSDMAAFRDISLNETGVERPDHVDTGFASANLLPMLGVRARIGRLFSKSDERPGNDHVVELSDAFFESHYHRDPAALGRSITLDGTSYTIIGVLPPRFHLPAVAQGMDQMKPDVWVPLSRLWKSADRRNRTPALCRRASCTRGHARPGPHPDGRHRTAGWPRRTQITTKAGRLPSTRSKWKTLRPRCIARCTCCWPRWGCYC